MARNTPSKDYIVLKEREKIESSVFDKRAMLLLAKLIKKDIIATVDFPVSTGKEANVFRATTTEGSFLAVKIYRVETANFINRAPYLDGDPRFSNIKKNERNVVSLFARKEFKNLQICEAAKVHSPRPVYLLDNVVVMDFLGEGGLPYPTMNVVGPRGEKDLDSVLKDIKKMYKAGLVHADISEYNLMLGADAPYLIDFGQGVVLGHPKAMEFLERDVRNLLHYFERLGIKRDLQKTLAWIKK
ncbi:MAG: serine protein kinase RIO [Candidatus Micrarchaeota archaeon]